MEKFFNLLLLPLFGVAMLIYEGGQNTYTFINSKFSISPTSITSGTLVTMESDYEPEGLAD